MCEVTMQNKYDKLKICFGSHKRNDWQIRSQWHNNVTFQKILMYEKPFKNKLTYTWQKANFANIKGYLQIDKSNITEKYTNGKPFRKNVHKLAIHVESTSMLNNKNNRYLSK